MHLMQFCHIVSLQPSLSMWKLRRPAPKRPQLRQLGSLASPADLPIGSQPPPPIRAATGVIAPLGSRLAVEKGHQT